MPTKKKTTMTRKPAAPKSEIDKWRYTEYSPTAAYTELKYVLPPGSNLYRCEFDYKQTYYIFDILGNGPTTEQLRAEALLWVKKNRGENG